MLGSVPFRGVIDRVEVEADGLAISDYKSGRAPNPRFAEERLSQVLLYAAAVEAELGPLAEKRLRLLALDDAFRIMPADANDRPCR